LPNRRDFLKVGGALGLGALAAGGAEYYIAQKEISDLRSELEKSSKQLETNLNVYNWYDYIAPGIFEDFADQYDVSLNYTTYSNPDEMSAKVSAGGSGLDTVVASDYKVGEMISLDILAKMDFAKVANFKHISEKFRNPPFDQKQEYSVPYMWGTTGIGYNVDVVTDEFAGFEILFDEDKISKYSKKVVVVDEMREVFAAALKHLGYSLNDTNEEHLLQAKELIMKIKPHILKFSADQVKTLLISGDAVLALGYSTDVFLASTENDKVRYKIPEEGGTLWMDNFVILKEAKNVNTSHKFIDYMLTPAIEAVNTNYLFIANPCLETVERGYVYPEIANDANIFPPEDVLSKMEMFRPFTLEEKDRMGKLWTEIRS